MKVVDANVLLYAVNVSSPHHAAAHRWLDRALSGSDSIGFTWIVVTAFLRLSTKVGLFPRPLTTADALDILRLWLQAPGACVLEPGGAHLTLLGRLLDEAGTGGNLVNDAHLAAVALEHRADIVSYDTDFTRFDGIRCYRPEDLLD